MTGTPDSPAGLGPQRRSQATGGDSVDPAISADGRWITYSSYAANLVDNDTNGQSDVFLFDRDTGLTRRVSVRSDGGQATGGSCAPAISADGRWITYDSNAANLVDDDTNGIGDVFLFDRDTGTTRRVSVRSDGGQATGDSFDPAISADGRWITYCSYADEPGRQRHQPQRTTCSCSTGTPGPPGGCRSAATAARPPGAPGAPAISADGRWITYCSYAENLVDNDTNTGPTCSSTTGTPGSPGGSRSAATAARPPARLLASVRRSAPTAAGSPTTRTRRTWSTTTPTAGSTCSCSTGTPATPGGSRSAATEPRPPAAAPTAPGDQRRRPVDHLQLVRGEPGRQRHQHGGRRVPDPDVVTAHGVVCGHPAGHDAGT